MKVLALKQKGFAHIEILIVAIVLIGIGFAGYKVVSNKKDDGKGAQNAQATSPPNDSGPPVWEYDQSKLAWYVKSGTAPACKEPFTFDVSPVDMSKITAVGLPGAYRGFSYKAHGGFRAAASTKGKVDVKMPYDATLKNITRYYEKIPGNSNELQYLLSFESDCGIAFRFDHLYTLAPAFQAQAEKSPPPKQDDTSGNPGAPINITFKAGDLVATEVGFKQAQNYGFDFGVYDYRRPNEISKNSQWAEIHKPFSATTFHGVCWLPMLPGADASKAEAMAKDRSNYNSSKPFNLTSDYCDFAPHKTLEFNNGQPTDG